MLNEILESIAAALLFAVILMAVIWWISVRIHNAGIVDIAWASGFAPVAILYGICTHGDPHRRGVVSAMAMLWSLRLGGYLYFRVMGHHPKEDRRYAKLREEWGVNVNNKMFWFFQMQAALMVVLSLPFLLACLNPAPSISWLEWAGVAVWVVALAGEGLSDHQLKNFKANPANAGRVCQAGLWACSRHPNYFFEWLIWVAFWLFALASPWGWVTIYCPALMLFFLLRVTGIPMTEELAVKTKGQEYIDYQKTTSAFVPWFRRSL
jgi:steroid 5-alpha reductase family enzyme